MRLRLFFEVLNLKFEVWYSSFVMWLSIGMTSSPLLFSFEYFSGRKGLRCEFGLRTLMGAVSPRGETLAKFFKNSLFFHCASNGHGPRPPNPVVFLKMTPKFWGKFRKWDLDFFWSFFFEFFFFWDFEFDVLNLKFLLILKFWIWPQHGAGAIP